MTTRSDAELQTAFATAALPAAELTHADHVRLAWLYLRAARSTPAYPAPSTPAYPAPLPAAIAGFAADLRRFAAAHGVPGKYHETITWAWLLLVNERLAHAGRDATWDEFAAANADLLASDALLRWYHPATLASAHARAVFVLPDRLAPR